MDEQPVLVHQPRRNQGVGDADAAGENDVLPGADFNSRVRRTGSSAITVELFHIGSVIVVDTTYLATSLR